MSKFYATIAGSRGPATRTGTRNSGIKAAAQSYDGSVITYLSYNDKDELIIELWCSDYSRSCGDQRLFRGTLQELKDALGG